MKHFMKYIKLMTIASLAIVLCFATCSIAESKVAATTEVEKTIPQAKIQELQSHFEKPNATSQADSLKKRHAQMLKALALGGELEKQYPTAKEIHQVRMLLMQATFFMSQSKKGSGKYAKQLVDIAGRIAKSKAPLDNKVIADFLLTQQVVKAASNPDARKKKIRAYIKKYAKTTAAPSAYTFATRIAMDTAQHGLTDTLADEMEKKFPNDRGVQNFLKNTLGRSKFTNKPFIATMTKLDGSKLVLPKDLKGKVVVIDFWATWCGPCRATIPHLKKVYDKYKSRGVEVVGISLDNNRRDLDSYIKEMDMTWIITYSGKGWKDPTTRKYGISGIPSLWVLGKDGKVYSTNARGDLEGTIERALKVKVKK